VRNALANLDSERNFYSYGNADCNCNANAHTYTYSKGYPNAEVYPGTETPSHSATETVARCIPARRLEPASPMPATGSHVDAERKL
jgi:hypothetical protein